MKKEELKEFQYLCQKMLVSKMLDYVREHGEDVTDYERNEFGLEDDEDCKITKVLNFVDNGGCCFSLPNGVNIDEEFECDDLLEFQLKTENYITFYAVQCLYIEEFNGTEYLMSYSLYNGGLRFLDDLSEPDHQSMLNESLEYVTMIANAILKD